MQIKAGQLHGALFYKVVVPLGREERQVEVQEQGHHECLLCVSDLWWLQRLRLDFKVEDFNLHASAEATTTAEKILLGANFHHHTRPHGWPRTPGKVHFFKRVRSSMMGNGTTTSARLNLIVKEDAKGLADPLVVQPVDCCSQNRSWSPNSWSL